MWVQQTLALDDSNIPEADELPISTPDSFDPYVILQLSLLRGQDNTMEFAHILKRKKDSAGNPIGIANDKPILGSRNP
jgi:hypothetical protein